MTGKGSLNHNSRKFHAKNTDPNRTHWNVEYCNEDIKDVYHELFDEALKRYNDKQTRKDRKIDDYYEKIRSGKQEKLFHEVILQIGDKDNMRSETMEGQLAAKILDEYMKGFQERNPTLRVFAAHLHLDEATPHLHIDFIPYVTGSKRGLDTRVSLKQALSSLGFKGGSRSETELNQWVQSEKEKLAMVMRENEIEWEQKGTHEPHLSVLDYKKKVREQEVEELTEHKNLLEHDLHDISECVDEIQKEKEQVEKERDAVIKKTEVLEKRFSALNSKAGLIPFVVPAVPITTNGISPAFLSSKIVFSKSSVFILKSGVVGILRILLLGIPIMRRPFATELCVWSEIYATPRCKVSSVSLLSRAAVSAVIFAIEPPLTKTPPEFFPNPV